MAWLHLLCPSTLLQHNETNILAGFVEYNSKREIIFSIFLTLKVKSYLILINFWKIVRILMISEKSDLGTHSGKGSKKKNKINYGKFHIGSWPPPLTPCYGKFFLFFFLKLDHFLRTFCKKCIFTIENPKKLRKFFKKW